MAITEERAHFSIWKLFLSALLVAFIVVAVGCSVVLKDVKSISISESATIDIPEGAGSAVVAQQLHDSGVIKYPTVFRIVSKINKFDGQYKPGTITVHSGMSYNAILRSITSERTIKVVIPEGYNLKQIAEALSSAGVCSADEFYAALDPSLYNYKFLEGIPERENRLEGYLFPATYEFLPGTSAQDVVNTMLKSFDNVFSAEYYAKTAEMGMTVDEIVIMASIVERETNSEAERAKVAGVFYNRLNINMKLDSCATVQYALGDPKAELSNEDTRIDSPYNTYINPGLPIGPIASPGEACIKAALYPEETDALYFLLGTDGKHIFSKTHEKHMEAKEANGL